MLWLAGFVVVAIVISLVWRAVFTYFFGAPKLHFFDNLDTLIKFYPSDLKQFDGSKKNWPICLAVFGVVFEVTSHPDGQKHYGPNGRYQFLAGHDCTVALGKMEFNASLLNKTDVNSQLNKDEFAAAIDWLRFMSKKYTPVGYVVDWRDAAPTVIRKKVEVVETSPNGPLPSPHLDVEEAIRELSLKYPQHFSTVEEDDNTPHPNDSDEESTAAAAGTPPEDCT